MLRCRRAEKDFVGQHNVKGPLQLVTQLDQREAVDSEIIGEPTVQRKRVRRVQLELIKQGPDISKYEILVTRRVRFVGHTYGLLAHRAR